METFSPSISHLKESITEKNCILTLKKNSMITKELLLRMIKYLIFCIFIREFTSKNSLKQPSSELKKILQSALVQTEENKYWMQDSIVQCPR